MKIQMKKKIVKEICGNVIGSNDESVILAPKNIDVISYNNEISNIMEGEPHIYLSIDTTEDKNKEDLDIMLPEEFLNTLKLNGLPPHRLITKVGAVIILLKNVCGCERTTEIFYSSRNYIC